MAALTFSEGVSGAFAGTPGAGAGAAGGAGGASSARAARKGKNNAPAAKSAAVAAAVRTDPREHRCVVIGVTLAHVRRLSRRLAGGNRSPLSDCPPLQAFRRHAGDCALV